LIFVPLLRVVLQNVWMYSLNTQSWPWVTRRFFMSAFLLSYVQLRTNYWAYLLRSESSLIDLGYPTGEPSHLGFWFIRFSLHGADLLACVIHAHRRVERVCWTKLTSSPGMRQHSTSSRASIQDFRLVDRSMELIRCCWLQVKNQDIMLGPPYMVAPHFNFLFFSIPHHMFVNILGCAPPGLRVQP
jgi:hypothetical protein